MTTPANQTRTRSGAEVPRLGRYRVCYRIAQGGMASVYLARLDTTAGFSKWVALKIIHPNIAADQKFVEMFLDEARLAARLDHPNLCTVFDFGSEEGTYFIAMEYLHGETLGSVARVAWSTQGALPIDLGVRVVADAARGLHGAHELRGEDGRLINVVHRDVSPENIFVTYTGSAKVVDFGVARSSDQVHERTATGELKGKLAYMSPEQLHEKVVDRRTDVWALGVVLWEVTVGRRLFRRPTDAATVFAITRDPITLPSRLRDDYPPALESIVMKALERDASRRYATALELSRALEAWLASSGHPTGIGEVGEFMQALFAEQMNLRDTYLRHADVAFEDLVHTWGASPGRKAQDAADANTVAMGFAIDGSPRRTPPSAGPPRPAPRHLDPTDPDATIKASALRFGVPEESDVIPLTRTVLPAAGRRVALASTPPSEKPVTPLVAPSAVASPRPLASLRIQRRHRWWEDVVILSALVALGAVMVNIWFDRPSPRASQTLARAPRTTHVQTRHAVTPSPRSLVAPVVAAPVVEVDAGSGVVPSPSGTLPREHRSSRTRSDDRAREPLVADDDRRNPGYLSVTSNLASEVFIGARRLGRTPLLGVELSPGVYLIRVVPLEREAPREVLVTIRPEQTAFTPVTWQPHELTNPALH
jgi:serine/threonine-protein kinase